MPPNQTTQHRLSNPSDQLVYISPERTLSKKVYSQTPSGTVRTRKVKNLNWLRLHIHSLYDYSVGLYQEQFQTISKNREFTPQLILYTIMHHKYRFKSIADLHWLDLNRAVEKYKDSDWEVRVFHGFLTNHQVSNSFFWFVFSRAVLMKHKKYSVEAMKYLYRQRAKPSILKDMIVAIETISDEADFLEVLRKLEKGEIQLSQQQQKSDNHGYDEQGGNHHRRFQESFGQLPKNGRVRQLDEDLLKSYEKDLEFFQKGLLASNEPIPSPIPMEDNDSFHRRRESNKPRPIIVNSPSWSRSSVTTPQTPSQEIASILTQKNAKDDKVTIFHSYREASKDNILETASSFIDHYYDDIVSSSPATPTNIKTWRSRAHLSPGTPSSADSVFSSIHDLYAYDPKKLFKSSDHFSFNSQPKEEASSETKVSSETKISSESKFSNEPHPYDPSSGSSADSITEKRSFPSNGKIPESHENRDNPPFQKIVKENMIPNNSQEHVDTQQGGLSPSKQEHLNENKPSLIQDDSPESESEEDVEINEYYTNYKSIFQTASWKAELLDIITQTRAELEQENLHNSS